MAKVLTDIELGEIVNRVVENPDLVPSGDRGIFLLSGIAHAINEGEKRKVFAVSDLYGEAADKTAKAINLRLAEIIFGEGEVADYDQFISSLGRAVAHSMGASFIASDPPLDPAGETGGESRYCCLFQASAETPPDGGVFADYDTDVSVEEWISEFPGSRLNEDDEPVLSPGA